MTGRQNPPFAAASSKGRLASGLVWSRPQRPNQLLRSGRPLSRYAANFHLHIWLNDRFKSSEIRASQPRFFVHRFPGLPPQLFHRLCSGRARLAEIDRKFAPIRAFGSGPRAVRKRLRGQSSCHRRSSLFLVCLHMQLMFVLGGASGSRRECGPAPSELHSPASHGRQPLPLAVPSRRTLRAG